jgi:ABC-type multidrug transport system ATPase subunit
MFYREVEEADVLGDRIAIMADGRMRAIGNSISLKQKFGTGYKIHVSCLPEKIAAAKESLSSVLDRGNQNGVVRETVEIEVVTDGDLIYQFPESRKGEIPAFVKHLEDSGATILSWSISQTTLEDVFLKIIREAKEEKAMKKLD